MQYNRKGLVTFTILIFLTMEIMAVGEGCKEIGDCYNHEAVATWSGEAWLYDDYGGGAWVDVSECPGKCAVD